MIVHLFLIAVLDYYNWEKNGKNADFFSHNGFQVADALFMATDPGAAPGVQLVDERHGQMAGEYHGDQTAEDTLLLLRHFRRIGAAGNRGRNRADHYDSEII